MRQKFIRRISTIFLIVSLGLWTGLIIPSFLSERKKTKETIQETWQEQPQQLSTIEQATMSASFSEDFEKNMEAENTPPTPTPLFLTDIPASMAGDMIAPTVTIQSPIVEGATITYTNPCFPLWVTDNMTPWQRLQTRAKLDNTAWSDWRESFSYCFTNLTPGAHTFSVQIRDLAGNVSSEGKRTFIVE